MHHTIVRTLQNRLKRDICMCVYHLWITSLEAWLLVIAFTGWSYNRLSCSCVVFLSVQHYERWLALSALVSRTCGYKNNTQRIPITNSHVNRSAARCLYIDLYIMKTRILFQLTSNSIEQKSFLRNEIILRDSLLNKCQRTYSPAKRLSVDHKWLYFM
jgi:hypothetical protein